MLDQARHSEDLVHCTTVCTGSICPFNALMCSLIVLRPSVLLLLQIQLYDNYINFGYYDSMIIKKLKVLNMHLLVPV